MWGLSCPTPSLSSLSSKLAAWSHVPVLPAPAHRETVHTGPAASRPPAAGLRPLFRCCELCDRELLGELWDEHVSSLLPLHPREGTVGSRGQTTSTTESYTLCLGRAGETRAEQIRVNLARGSGSGEQGTAPWAASSDLLLTRSCGDLSVSVSLPPGHWSPEGCFVSKRSAASPV